MNAKNIQQLEVQVIELGTATELTLGAFGTEREGKGHPSHVHSHRGMTTQITELGAATELTLGCGGPACERYNNRFQ